MAMSSVEQGARERGQQENRHLTGEPDKSEQDSRSSKSVYQPGLGDHLHPGADQRDELAGNEQPVVAIPQRAKQGRQASPRPTLRLFLPAARTAFWSANAGRQAVGCGLLSSCISLLFITRRDRILPSRPALAGNSSP